jgi:hypothetical protein
MSSGRSTMDRPNARAARRTLGLVGRSRPAGIQRLTSSGDGGDDPTSKIIERSNDRQLSESAPTTGMAWEIGQ